MIIYIKNMVSHRCKIIVKQEFKRLGIKYNAIELGMVNIPEDFTQIQREELTINLLNCGLELLDDKKSIVIEKLKM